MTLHDQMLDRLMACTAWPPFITTRALFDICNDEPANADIAETMCNWFFKGVIGKLPKNFLTTYEEYAAEFEKWRTDEHAYFRQPTVMLYDLLPMAEVVKSTLGHFLYLKTDFTASKYLTDLRRQLKKNDAMAHGFSDYEWHMKDTPLPEVLDDEPYKLVEKFFHHTPFYDFFTTPIPFRIEHARFNEHGFLFARSGHGKTQALRALIAQFLQETDPPALFLIDSLGALIEGIEELKVFNTTLQDRLVILDPSRSKYMPRLNFFGLRSDDMIFYLFKAIDQSFTQRQATMVSYVMEYMRAIPEPSILKFVEILKSKQLPHPEVVPSLSKFAQAFFQYEFYGKSDPFIQQTKAQIVQRLFTFGRIPKFNDLFSTHTATFDPYACMQSKKIVLINTDAREPEHGGLGAGSAVFGRYILAQCLSAARRRPQDKRHLALIICDEAKAYLDDQSALILSDARQYGMGMLLASQQPHQLPEGVRREVNTNTSIRFMGSIEYAIASQYARDMFTTPDFILGMKKEDYSHADWAVHVSGMNNAIKVRMPYGVLEKMPKQTHRPPAPEPPKALPPEPAAKKQQQNELSLRDTDLPLAETDKTQSDPLEEPPPRSATEGSGVIQPKPTTSTPDSKPGQGGWSDW